MTWVGLIVILASSSVASAPSPPPAIKVGPSSCWQLHEASAEDLLGVPDSPDFDAARRHLQQALDCMPASAPAAARARLFERLASITDDRDKAISSYRMALWIRQSSPGGADPAIPDTLWELGWRELAIGRRADGAAHIEEGSRILQTTYGPDHPRTAEALYRLGFASFAEGDPVKGEDHYRRSIAILEKLPQTADNDSVLSVVVLALGDALCTIDRCSEGQAMRDASRQIALRAERSREQEASSESH